MIDFLIRAKSFIQKLTPIFPLPFKREGADMITLFKNGTIIDGHLKGYVNI